MTLCPTLILTSSSSFNLKYCSVVRRLHKRRFWWSSMTVRNSASKVWNSSWMGIVMQYGGCVLACLPHSNLVMCNAGGLRRLKGRAKDENRSFGSYAYVSWTKLHSAADKTTLWHLLRWQYILTNAIVLVYFVPYLHYLCSVTHTKMYTIKKIRPEEAKCYHDISLEVMRKTCVNESSDSI